MANLADVKDFITRKKREFKNKRGRMGRSRFFVNLCLVCSFCLLYILILYLIVNGLQEIGLPRLVYNNIYYLGVGILFLLIAFGTRPLRLKRLRDIGMPVWSDLPFMLLLLSNGLGPIFYFFNIPYLRHLDVISMPDYVRDLLGVLWMLWLLVMILGPSKRRGNLFACSSISEQPSESSPAKAQ